MVGVVVCTQSHSRSCAGVSLYGWQLRDGRHDADTVDAPPVASLVRTACIGVCVKTGCRIAVR